VPQTFKLKQGAAGKWKQIVRNGPTSYQQLIDEVVANPTPLTVGDINNIVLKDFKTKAVIPSTHIFTEPGEFSMWFSSSKPRGSGSASSASTSTSRTPDFSIDPLVLGNGQPKNIKRYGTKVMMAFTSEDDSKAAINKVMDLFDIEFDEEAMRLQADLLKAQKAFAAKKKEMVAKQATATATASSSAASVTTATEEHEGELEDEDDADLLAEDDEEDEEGEAEVEVDDSDVVPLKTKGKR